MVSGELFQTYISRLEEARLYSEQGLGDGAVEVFHGILNELQQAELPDAEKESISSLIQKELEKVRESSQASIASQERPKEEQAPSSVDPAQSFEYAMALMDGQFWEDAIRELKKAAVVGNQMQECWELCGDCAGRLERWQEAISYYEIVYSQPNVPENLKHQILAKITKCTQALRKKEAKPIGRVKSANGTGQHGVTEIEEVKEKKTEYIAPSVASFDQSPASRLVGEQIASWRMANGQYLEGQRRLYRVANVSHVGISSVVLELEEEETGKHYAGQILNTPFDRSVPAESLARWARTQTLIDSQHLVTIHDVAHLEDHLCTVREHLPLSLGDLLGGGEAMPLPIATCLAYQILIALGDLHLHMGQDERIRRIFHLDLRPSRILLADDRPRLKINNGGLWKTLEECNPRDTAIHKLPLPFLAYRAPEQFRPYLSRRKPPIFTDIYLFGAIFYQMLTGVPAFRASSFEEYEIQHCEQYPTPPKVWRRDIPEGVNDIVMKCLELDPFKRWRSTTELALLLEKTFTNSCNPSKDGSYVQFLGNIKPN